jgi:hypothetical protein
MRGARYEMLPAYWRKLLARLVVEEHPNLKNIRICLTP